MRRFLIGTTILCGLALAFQGPQPETIPQCRGEECRDDYGNIVEGQPRFCINFDTPKYKKNCECKKECEDKYATGCVRHCGMRGCHCDHGCGS